MRALVRAILFGSVIAGLLPMTFAQTGVSPETPVAAAVSPTVTEAQDVNTQHALSVIFSSGKLTISAKNCSLQEVLQEVHSKTGATLEGSAFDSTPVTIQLGPGEPMKVLASLLYGSRFNYIIVANNVDDAPGKIVLSVRNVVSTPSAPAPVVAQLAAPPPIEKAVEQTATDEKQTVAELKPEASADKANDKKDAAPDGDKDEQASKKQSDEDTLADGSVKGEAVAASEPTAAERLANLPPGIDPAMASLYPSLFGGASANSSASGFPTSGTTAGVSGINPVAGTQTPTAWNPGALQYGAGGVPILPQGISPEMWNLYPKNLMDLIRSGGTNPGAVVVPTTPVATGFWDQTIRVPH